MLNKYMFILWKATFGSPGIRFTLHWHLLESLQTVWSWKWSPQFQIKLLQGLLVTKQRMHQFSPGTPATCAHCDDDIEKDHLACSTLLWLQWWCRPSSAFSCTCSPARCQCCSSPPSRANRPVRRTSAANGHLHLQYSSHHLGKASLKIQNPPVWH